MFEGILRELLESAPGTRGVVFCASDGETVNCIGASGRTAPDAQNDYDLRVAAAQLALPLDLARENAHETIGAVQECVITGTNETLIVHTLPEGYYLLMCLEPGALVGRALWNLRTTAQRVAVEI